MSFIEELLEQAEIREQKESDEYHDLLLIQIRELQEQIACNFAKSEFEAKIIKDWALKKNSALQEKVEWIEKQLEGYIILKGVKTLELPNGVLKNHKKPDKVEITDMELFLSKAKPEMLTVIPETVKADLTKIKSYIKTHPIPPGVTVIEGKESFTYTLNERKEEENGSQKIRASA